MATQQERVKCTRCKVNLTVDKFKTKRDDTLQKICIECNKKASTHQQLNKYKCEHGKQCKSRCRECLGRPVNDGRCSRCKKTFEQDIEGLATCPDCRYTSDCPHGVRIKGDCPQCQVISSAKYRSYCEHNRRKDHCTQCNPNIRMCEHNKRKDTCVICTGCPHSKRRNICKDCDPNGYLISIVRGEVRRALNRDKDDRSINYLGCTIEQFKEHIESQFTEGIDWNNHGKVWEIDHRVPLKYRENGEPPTLEQSIQRLHWTNTQPLLKEKNREKGNRYCS